MMASTARMTAPAPSGKRGRSSLSGRNYLIRPLEIAPATGADLHVDRLQLPALGAGAPRLAVLGAVEIAASVPSSGSTAPTRNQIQNELPLSLPITAAERPQKNARTTNSTRPLSAARRRPR